MKIPSFKFKKFDILKLPLKRSFENISLEQDLAQNIVPVEVYRYFNFRGVLSAGGAKIIFVCVTPFCLTWTISAFCRGYGARS